MWPLRWWMIFCSASALNFTSIWRTSVSNQNITLPLSGSNLNISVDWGDGVFSPYTTIPVSHLYSVADNYTIRISGQYKGFAFNNRGDVLKIIEVSQWGGFTVDDSSIGVFNGCSNLKLTALDQPTFAINSVVDSMFEGCVSLSGPALFWNITNVKSLVRMFASSSYNAAINFTGTSALTSTRVMFDHNTAFNSTIVFDNTSKLTTVAHMFDGATAFNQPILFDTSHVTDFTNMFLGAVSYNQPISFSTQSAVTLAGMFAGCTSFNQPINFTTGAQYFSNLFENCSQFNSSVTFSDTSNVVTTEAMFLGASSFNQPLNFSTGSVINMDNMFNGARWFNQPLNFNTTKVQTMNFMFKGDDMFVQDLSAWNVPNVTNCSSFCFYCVLPVNMSCTPCSGGIKRALIGSVCECSGVSLTSPTTCGAFISTWNFSTGNYSFPLSALDARGLRIDWGDNITETGVMSSRYHNYFSSASMINITIWGKFELSDSLQANNIHMFLISISAWGEFSITNTSVGGHFMYCSNLYLLAQDQPRILPGASLSSMFEGCMSLTSPVALSWDISGALSLTSMFFNCISFNSSLNFTNTDSVINMTSFLFNAQSFNQSLDSFNTTNVMRMDYMFINTYNFNQPLHFDTRSVITMESMFHSSAYNSPINFSAPNLQSANNMFNAATAFNQPITFYTPKLTSASYMFASAAAFNQSLVWDVPLLRDASSMFQYATSLNSPITFTSCQNLATVGSIFANANQFNSMIKLVNATNLSVTSKMFQNATNFNQALDFLTNNVTDMTAMFQGAVSFNQTLNFTTSKAQYMSYMFNNTSSFQQNLRAWNVSSVIEAECESFCDFCGLPDFMFCQPCPLHIEYNSSRGQVCGCLATEYRNQSQCVAIPCTGTGYTGPDNACRCADGYGPGVKYAAEMLSGCALLPCNVTGYTGPDGNCTCASGYKGRVSYVNGALSGCSAIGPFAFAWSTTVNNQTITLPFPNPATCNNILISWGDGVEENGNTCVPISHSYNSTGTHAINISNPVRGFSFSSGIPCDQLLRIDSWGEFQVDAYSAHTFDGCSNVISFPITDEPVILPGADMSFFFAGTNFATQTLPFSWNLSNVVSMKGMFSNITALGFSQFNPYTANVKDMSQLFFKTNFNATLQFDTSQVTNMDQMFAFSNVSQSLDFLQTSNVVTMVGMFQNTPFFNQRLDNFVTSNVTSMQSMFAGSNYNQPLSFDTQNVRDMYAMFSQATQFNSVLNFSSTKSVLDMSSIFFRATAFSGPISFDTRNVVNMNGMFQNANAFNMSSLSLDTSSATDLSKMFSGATNFTPYTLNFTNTSLVTAMDYMFFRTPINCPLNFDTRRVKTMTYMFGYTTQFQQSLLFDTSNVSDFSGMFTNSVHNQNISFNTNNATLMVSMFKDAQYFNSALNFTSTAAVTSMAYMLNGASAYNAPFVKPFDGSNLMSTAHMFDGARSFNRSVSFQNVSYLNDTSYMFFNASKFNANVSFGNFANSNNTDMSYMFAGASAYNQPLTFSLSTLNLSHMFAAASSFVQNVSYKGANFSAPCDNFCPFCGILPHPGTANATGYCRPCQNDFYYFNAANVTVCKCPSGQSIGGSNVCGCPTGQSLIGGVCVLSPSETSAPTPTFYSPTLAPSLAPTVASVVYSSNSNKTTINASGVQVTITSDPVFGGNGTVTVAVKPPNATVSPIVAIDFFDSNSTKKSITGLSHPIVFVIPLVVGTVTSIQACLGESPGIAMPLCNWFDTVDNIWKTSGCTTRILSAAQVECSCTHLTDFAALIPKVNHIPSSQFLALTPTNINAHPDGLITIVVVLVLFLAVFVVSLLRDQTEKKREEALREKKYDKWTKAAESQVNIGFKQKWWKAYKSGLQLRHTWGSLIFRKSGTTFRSVDRAVVMLFMLLMTMTMSASFHNRNTAVVTRAEVMVFNILACLAPSLVLTHLFTHTGELGFYEKYQIQRGMITPSKNRILRYRFSERWRYVWYVLALVCVIVMIVYILSIALMFDQNPTYYCQGQTTASWIVDFIVPYVINVFAIEPLKIFFFIATKNAVKTFATTRTRLGGESASEMADTGSAMDMQAVPEEATKDVVRHRLSA